MSQPSEKPAELAQGATIGRYVVLALIGRGGMGEVYAAYDPELDRKIAVKLLRTREDEPDGPTEGRTRLLREAQAIARLSHPNVVVVYDVGTFRDSVFIAMEFVDGHTLTHWLAAKPRRPREVIEVFLAAGRGLVAAHEAGLMHRDFKPDNVMITGGGLVRVMDFGLARQLTDDEPESSDDVAERAAAAAEALAPGALGEVTVNLASASLHRTMQSSSGYLHAKLTMTGAILGTPAYMAPEQLGGRGGDARSDQFSFCVALYEGLYGERPFAGDTLLALMANVAAATVRPPRAEVRVPSWIRKVLLRGLLSRREERFPSMAALLVALGQDPAVRRWQWVGGATGGLLVFALAAGAHRYSATQRTVCAGGPGHTAAAWGAGRRKAMRLAFDASGNRRATENFATVADLLDRYVAKWNGMYSEACQATQLKGEQSPEVMDLRMACLDERLSSFRAVVAVLSDASAGVVDNAVSAASALPTLDRCADVAMLRAVIKPPDDPTTRARVASVREQVAEVSALSMAGQCDRALTLGHHVVDQATAVGYLPLKAEALFAMASGSWCLEPAKAAEALEQAILAAEASGHDEIDIRASAIIEAPDLRSAKFWLAHADAILSRFPGRHPVLEAWIALGKANTFSREGRYEDALREAKRSLVLKEAALGPIDVDTVISEDAVANALHNLGRDGEAEPMARAAVAGFDKLLGDDSAHVAMTLTIQSEVLTGLHRFDEASAALDRALAIWEEQRASPLFVGYTLLDRGRLQVAEGHPRQARETLERALVLIEKSSAGTLSDAIALAEVELTLARVLWDSPRSRDRSVALADSARLTLAAFKVRPPKLSADLDTWLAAQQAR